jgi:hypothetical protein
MEGRRVWPEVVAARAAAASGGLPTNTVPYQPTMNANLIADAIRIPVGANSCSGMSDAALLRRSRT